MRLIQAPDLPEDVVAEALRGCSLPVRVIRNDRLSAIASSHLALCASGTATLEVGLTRTPMVVVYKVSTWSYLLGRLAIRVPHISLVNLVLGDGVVPELIQAHATEHRVASVGAALLSDGDRRNRMRARLGELREALGEPGASRRAALETAKIMQGAWSGV